MKNLPPRRQAASTREVLTVLGIIALLTGLLYPAVLEVRKKELEKTQMAEEAAARQAQRQNSVADAYAAQQKAEAQAAAQAAAKQAEEAAKQAELDQKLVVFTKEHVPELYAAIEKIEKAVDDWTARCSEIEADLKLVMKDPESDPDIQRWRTAVADMKTRLAELREQRKDAWIAYRKFERAPSGKTEYERQLILANKAAADSQVYHKKMQARLESK